MLDRNGGSEGLPPEALLARMRNGLFVPHKEAAFRHLMRDRTFAGPAEPHTTSGDGGGSNSPSKALDRIASTSVASGLLSRGPGRALARFRSRQPVIFDPPTGHSADRSPTHYALPGPQGGDREDGH